MVHELYVAHKKKKKKNNEYLDSQQKQPHRRIHDEARNGTQKRIGDNCYITGYTFLLF